MYIHILWHDIYIYIYLYVHESIYMIISFLAAQIITCSLPCLKHDTSFKVPRIAAAVGMCPFGTNPKWYHNCPYIQYWFNKWYHNKDITGIYIYWWYTGYFRNLEFAKPKIVPVYAMSRNLGAPLTADESLDGWPMTLVWQKTALSE